MLRTIAIASLPVLALLGFGSGLLYSPAAEQQASSAETGVVEKMIVASGDVSLNVDAAAFIRGVKSNKGASGTTTLNFRAEPDSFLKSMFFNGEFRGFLPGSMPIHGKPVAGLPSQIAEAYPDLVLEANPFGSRYEFSIRDAKADVAVFNIEGHEYGYDAATRTLTISGARLIVSDRFARELGVEPLTQMGDFSASLVLRPIEVSRIEQGEVTAQTLPAGTGAPNNTGTVPGPDVMVGDLNGLAQFGSSINSQVGLAVGTDSCNFGTIDLNWFANPNNDHPVIPQNMYRMSGGPNNDERFEQIGQSSVKHAFTALTEDICSLGCNNVGGSRLGSGCSDPYSASLNAGPGLGSRAWINPFTGFFPRNDSATPNNSHTGHDHSTKIPHRILTNVSDLANSQNPGATYYAEAQYITPHEYAWCQANPGQCNMYNNVSYRKYNVIGSTSPFSFSPAESTTRGKPAVMAWPGSTYVQFEPAPGQDGIGAVAYKVTNPSPGVWRYEYAVYNQNIDRAISSFAIPVAPGVTITNVGFHAPPQHPGWSGDGTVGNAGFSSTPWTSAQVGNWFTWSTETFAQNPNANAIRWGTMYNFRFESDRPPAAANATIGFFKTGSPITVAVRAPSSPAVPVVIAGRVADARGRAINQAKVTLTGPGGTRIATTSSFGYFRFDGVMSQSTYTISVSKRLYTFTPRDFTPSGNITDANFNAAPR